MVQTPLLIVIHILILTLLHLFGKFRSFQFCKICSDPCTSRLSLSTRIVISKILQGSVCRMDKRYTLWYVYSEVSEQISARDLMSSYDRLQVYDLCSPASVLTRLSVQSPLSANARNPYVRTDQGNHIRRVCSGCTFTQGTYSPASSSRLSCHPSHFPC